VKTSLSYHVPIMSKIPCSSCGQPNEEGVRFCTRCGQSCEARVHCPSCNALQAAGDRFCMRCGAAMAGARWQEGAPDGAVAFGLWERGQGEFIRRVDPEDCRTFLGARVVRIPPGTFGAVMVDGLVERILPPGEQTSVTLFERIASFFTRRDDRTAFYLVDQRPIPVPFAVQTRPGADGRVVQTQVVVSFGLQRGDKEGLASFIASVLGGKASFAARDLYDLLRPEVTASASQILERLASKGAFTYEAAEAAIRHELSGKLARYGLTLSVTVAPLTTTSSLSFHLGTGEAPEVKPCADCGAELPLAMKFCDRCGKPQPAVLSPARICGACSARVAAGHAFCDACGKPYAAPPRTAAPLFTTDGARVEVDLVVRVQGQHEDFAPERITEALVGAIAAHLRSVTFAALVSAGGFSAAEQAVRGTLEQALASFGLVLVTAAVVDVRDKRGQWILGARADLTRARDDVLLGREWLAQRADEINLEELTFAQKLETQRIEREAKLTELRAELDGVRRKDALEADHAFDRDQASLDDRRRREGLAYVEAELDAAGAERGANRDQRVAAAQRSTVRAEQAMEREDELEAQRHGSTRDELAFQHKSTLARGAMDLDAEKRRLEGELGSEAARRGAEDAAFAAKARKDVEFEDQARKARLDDELKAAEGARQLEKLRGMAEIDRKMVEVEHVQKRELRESLKGMSEREMIAAQAAELAKAEGGGAAWAAALAGDEARRLGAEQSARIEEVMKQQLDRMERLATTAMDTGARRAGGTDQVYEKSMDAMSKVATSRAAPAPVASVIGGAMPGVPCKNPDCSAVFPPGTRFCGTCGAGQ
jgi:hypothetical protein